MTTETALTRIFSAWLLKGYRGVKDGTHDWAFQGLVLKTEHCGDHGQEHLGPSPRSGLCLPVSLCPSSPPQQTPCLCSLTSSHTAPYGQLQMVAASVNGHQTSVLVNP